MAETTQQNCVGYYSVLFCVEWRRGDELVPHYSYAEIDCFSASSEEELAKIVHECYKDWCEAVRNRPDIPDYLKVRTDEEICEHLYLVDVKGIVADYLDDASAEETEKTDSSEVEL
jgi:hypothetical protein